MVHDEHTIQRPFAVITCASEWFGHELAKQFASTGFDLIITSNDEDIHYSRDELMKFGVLVESYVLDLSTFKGVEDLYSAIKAFGHPVDALAVYAGDGPEGPFVDIDLNEELLLIRKNILSPIHLMKRIIKDMVVRGHGRVLISSNLGPNIQTPFESVYGATKSFLFSFSEGLRSEIRESGVTITTLLPNLYNSSSEAEMKAMEDPEELAQEAFEALMAGRDHVFETTIKTRLQDVFSRIIPNKARALISASSS